MEDEPTEPKHFAKAQRQQVIMSGFKVADAVETLHRSLNK